MRLIDADAHEYPGDLIHMPTIDAVPVVHGQWIEHPQYDVFGDCTWIDYECSKCNARGRYNTEDYKYCPSCGAKMDGGATNGNS